MGNTPHGKTYTAESLRTLASALESHAGTIRQLAEEMDLASVKSVYIIHGTGVHAAATVKLYQFTADGRKKVAAAVEVAKKKRKRRTS